MTPFLPQAKSTQPMTDNYQIQEYLSNNKSMKNKDLNTKKSLF